MTNEELIDLIFSIQLAVKDDYQAGIKTTTYTLPAAALQDEIIEVLQSKFEHYESISVTGNVLRLVHPEQDDQ